LEAIKKKNKLDFDLSVLNNNFFEFENQGFVDMYSNLIYVKIPITNKQVDIIFVNIIYFINYFLLGY
jgi:hypothetical protein